MARLSAYRKRLKVSVSTFSASLIHQHDIAEWNGKKGRRRTGNKSSLSVLRAFTHALSHPLGNLQREKSSLLNAQVPREHFSPLSLKKN